MAKGMPNLRTMTVDTGRGKDVKDTKMLSGQATKTKAEGETNETVEYTHGTEPHGKLGGMPSHT